MQLSRRTLLAAAPAAALLAACTSDRTATGTPPEVRTFAGDWPLPGRDHANSRAVRGTALRGADLDRLGEAWRTPLPGSSVYGNAATTPVVLGDTVYVQDLMSNVRAVDLASGRVRWERIFDVEQIGPNGVAAGWGLLVAGTGRTDVTAMDLRTGRTRWRRTLPRTGSVAVGVQPQVAAGLVLVATVPVDPEEGGYVGGSRGVLYALRADDGSVAWSFDTVKGGGDLWGDPKVNSGGGGGGGPTVDEATGTAYWGVGNPAPFPGTTEFPNGTSRPGPNLYTNSVVALSLEDGSLKWYRQASPHDLFDHDLMLTAMATTDDGPVLVATGKAGRVIGHDPRTGEVRWDTEVGVHRNDRLERLDGPTEVLPGGFGGVISPPALTDGTVYVAVVNLPTTYEPGTPALTPPELGQMPGEVVAVDAADGKVQWKVELPGDPMGGVLAVDDLLFTSTIDGTLYALDRADGAVRWTYQAPGGTNGWPALADDTLVWPVGIGDAPVLLGLRLR